MNAPARRGAAAQPQGGPGPWRRTLAVARKELLQLRRDPLLPRIILLFPLALLVFFGFALNTTTRNLPLAVVDHAQDRVSQALTAAFTANERFRAEPAADLAEALALVQAGRARAVLEIAPAALAAARAGEPVAFTLHLDGSDPSVSAQIRAAAAAAAAELSARLAAGRQLGGQGTARPLEAELVTLYNPDDRTAVYMVPGLIGLILTLIACLLTAIVIVREREVGTMEALASTPARPLEIVVGKVVPYFAAGLVSAALVVAAGMLVFGVPLRGSAALLALAMLLFILGSLGVGILISTLVRTQVQAMFGVIAYLFPSIFLSGFIFPVDGMAGLFQALSRLVPLRYFLELARGLMIRGAPGEALLTPFAALAAFAVLTLVAASWRFRKVV